MLKEASTITDIHNKCDDIEVELVSLIEEKIPNYRLRSNSVFDYSQSDWLQTPVLSPQTNVELSSEQCEETFKYFILSGDRLSQMTRTYHDIEAVTHLLEEKERDLELAARIGQTLLQKNREIVSRNEQLEDQLAGALEEASQLRHEISLKEDLLHIYADDETDSSGAPSPIKELRNFGRSGMYSHIEGLQNKMRKLESENGLLKSEQEQLRSETEDLENEEHQLVTDAVKQIEDMRQDLREANDQIKNLNDELSQKNEESVRQQEEITRLLTQVVDMQRKQKQLALENEELQQHLTAANNTQYELTREVQALEDRYHEVNCILNETRDEVRQLRDYPGYIETSVPFGDSLAAELECSGGMTTDFLMSGNAAGSYYNPSSGSIDWSSPPSSVTGDDGDVDIPIRHPLHSQENVADSTIQSEPALRTVHTESFSQRVLNTARFVNNLKNASSTSKFQYVTPRKHDRPIATALAVPGANKSSYFTRGSPESTPSSGRMSSTPHDNHRPIARSSLARNFIKTLPNFETPSKCNSPSQPHSSSTRPTPLRLQLANRKLAEKESSLHSTKFTTIQNSEFSKFNSIPHPILSALNQTKSSVPSHSEMQNKALNHSWHGESYDAYFATVCQKARLATPSLGRPGVPGTEDLERAIRKLALRRESARYMELEKRVAMNDKELFSNYCDSSGNLSFVSSTQSGGQTPPPTCPSSPRMRRLFRITGRSSKAPKLRIIKPLEGSVTLNQWKYLAERDHLWTALQTQSYVPAGVITREHAAEVLLKSRDGSMNNTNASENSLNQMSSPQPKKSRPSEQLNLSNLHPSISTVPIQSSPISKPKISDEEKLNQLSPPSTKAIRVCGNPGKNFALTSTLYTYTNSCIMNPTNERKARTPVCTSETVGHAKFRENGYFPSLTSTTTTSVTSGGNPFHPFVNGEARNENLNENTRTSSMQLGLAYLRKEQEVEKMESSQPTRDILHQKEASASTVPIIGSGEKSAFKKNSNVRHDQTSRGSHVVWNRSLQRSYLLPSLTTQNILFNFNRRSDGKNPETPPNSPLSTTPTHSALLLNEIMSKPTDTEEKVEKEKEDATFSSNLLSKLAQIGMMSFPVFRTSKSTAVSVTTTATTSTSSCTSVFSSPISKSATAPGSLLNSCKDPIAFASTPANSRTSLNSQNVITRLGSQDKGLLMGPVETDWSDLHGSSGCLNVQSCGITGKQAQSGGRGNAAPLLSSTPKEDQVSSESDDGCRHSKTDATKRRLKRSNGKKKHVLEPNSQTSSSTPLSSRPKSKTRAK